MKKKTAALLLIFVLVLSSTVLVSADSASALKTIYGASAPSAPALPQITEVVADWENFDAESKLPEIQADEWDAFFEFLKENDPDYYYGGDYEDICEGDYPYILAELDAAEAVSFSGMYELSEKVTETFAFYFEKYTDEYNQRVKEGTTYVTEDMISVKNSLPSFSPFDRSLVATFNFDMAPEAMTQTLQSVLGMLDMGTDALVEVPEENHFVAAYNTETYDETYENKISVHVKMDCYTYPEQNGCGFYEEIRDASDNSLVSATMHEFRKLDEETYAVQTSYGRLVVKYDGEKIGNFAVSGLKDSSSCYNKEEDSIFTTAKTMDADWVSDRDVNEYSVVSVREENDYMKVSNGGKYYTLYIEN